MHAVRDLRVFLRLRDFRSLLAARLLSQAADGVFQVALATFVVFSPEKQTSPAAIASAMAILLLPYSLLGPFTGVLLDRWRRRQVLLYGNLLRTLLAMATAALIVSKVPDWLFYASALSVTAVNRFVLAGLSAALPRVVDGEQQLVMANSLTPTAGTLAATAGGGLAFAVRLGRLGRGRVSSCCSPRPSISVRLSPPCAWHPQLLGPDAARPPTAPAGSPVEHGARAGRRAAPPRRAAHPGPRAGRDDRDPLLLRSPDGHGADAVPVPWSDTESEGLALLGITVGVSGAGFFVAAVVTPWAVGRLTAFGWIACCAAHGRGVGAGSRPVLHAGADAGRRVRARPRHPGTKISTDTVVQSSVDDAFRGRIFAIYDVLFNVAFVGAAAVAALMLPPDGRSAALLASVAVLYAVDRRGNGPLWAPLGVAPRWQRQALRRGARGPDTLRASYTSLYTSISGEFHDHAAAGPEPYGQAPYGQAPYGQQPYGQPYGQTRTRRHRRRPRPPTVSPRAVMPTRSSRRRTGSSRSRATPAAAAALHAGRSSRSPAAPGRGRSPKTILKGIGVVIALVIVGGLLDEQPGRRGQRRGRRLHEEASSNTIDDGLEVVRLRHLGGQVQGEGVHADTPTPPVPRGHESPYTKSLHRRRRCRHPLGALPDARRSRTPTKAGSAEGRCFT